MFSDACDNSLDLEGKEGVGGSGSLRTPGSFSESPRRITTKTLERRNHYMQNLTYSLFYQYIGCGKKNRESQQIKGKKKNVKQAENSNSVSDLDPDPDWIRIRTTDQK